MGCKVLLWWGNGWVVVLFWLLFWVNICVFIEQEVLVVEKLFWAVRGGS